MHTSVKARLTSVAIRICDPDSQQNLIVCSLVHCQPSLEISCKSVHNFFYPKLLTNRQTNKQQQLHILLGGGKYQAR